MSARFAVTSVSGWPIHFPLRHGATGVAPGLSAHVIDREWNCRVVASYRSEDRRGTKGGATIGVDGALSLAADHARDLNERYG